MTSTGHLLPTTRSDSPLANGLSHTVASSVPSSALVSRLMKIEGCRNCYKLQKASLIGSQCRISSRRGPRMANSDHLCLLMRSTNILFWGKADIAQTLRFPRYCFAGPGTIVPDAGFLSFCWAVFFFVGEFANRLKQLRRSSCSFRKRQSCTDLVGAETCFGSGFILSS